MRAKLVATFAALTDRMTYIVCRMSDICITLVSGMQKGCVAGQTDPAQQAPDAAEQAPADGDANDDFGDLGEVPMEWLQNPAAVGGGPAVEEEDYD